jgi:hypothetical protein
LKPYQRRLDEPLAPLDPAKVTQQAVRRLAAAVLLRAVDDLDISDAATRQDARRFLTDEQSDHAARRALWSGAAGLPAATVRRRALERLAGG